MFSVVGLQPIIRSCPGFCFLAAKHEQEQANKRKVQVQRHFKYNNNEFRGSGIIDLQPRQDGNNCTFVINSEFGPRPSSSLGRILQ